MDKLFAMTIALSKYVYRFVFLFANLKFCISRKYIVAFWLRIPVKWLFTTSFQQLNFLGSMINTWWCRIYTKCHSNRVALWIFMQHFEWNWLLVIRLTDYLRDNRHASRLATWTQPFQQLEDVKRIKVGIFMNILIPFHLEHSIRFCSIFVLYLSFETFHSFLMPSCWNLQLK